MTQATTLPVTLPRETAARGARHGLRDVLGAEAWARLPEAVRERIVTQLEFLETVTRWYDSVKRLPRKTLLKMMRMGERIAKVIGD